MRNGLWIRVFPAKPTHYPGSILEFHVMRGEKALL